MDLVKKLGRRKYNYDICKNCINYSIYKRNKTIRPTSHSCFFTTETMCSCKLGRFRECRLEDKHKRYSCSDIVKPVGEFKDDDK